MTTVADSNGNVRSMVSSDISKSLPKYCQNGLRFFSTFRCAIQMCLYKIKVLIETGLTESINSNKIPYELFPVFRCDRHERSSDKNSEGSVLVTVHSL